MSAKVAAVVEAEEVAETREEAVARRDQATIERYGADRILSTTRAGYGNQLVKYREFFEKHRNWTSAQAQSESVFLEGVGPPPDSVVWTKRLRQRELVVCIAYMYEEVGLKPTEVKKFCKGLGDQMRTRGYSELADLLKSDMVMVARKHKYRETARLEAVQREEDACKMLEGALVIEYAREQWLAGASSANIRLVDRAIMSVVMLTMIQCSLRISSLCRTESVDKQRKPEATRCLAPGGGVALDRNILWCADVSFALRGVEVGPLLVVRTAFQLSQWWAANPEGEPYIEWMGIAFRTCKSNADGKRANKFRIERDCVENGEYLDRIKCMVGMAAYNVEYDAFFSRPVSEQVGRTLDRRRVTMVDGWSATKRADHEHEGRWRHVFTESFANMMCKEVASSNGLSDDNVSTKSLKALAITALDEARDELGLSQQQVAAHCDHMSIAGNAAYKLLKDRKSLLSVVAKAAKRPVSWGVSAVPEVAAPVKSRKRKASVMTSESVGPAVVERVGKRASAVPERFRK